MTIIQLEYLLAVVNCGSFSAAARKCFVTQPSLSMQIKSLEQELGGVLLDRTKKPVVPTDLGEAVIKQAKEALNAFDAVKEVVNDIRGEVSGSVRVGVLSTVSPYILHLLMPKLSERCPNVEVQVVEMTATEITAGLNNDTIDVGILSSGTTPENIKIEELFNDRFYIYLSPRSPLSARTNIRLEELTASELLLLCERHCLRYQVAELLPSIYGDPQKFSSQYSCNSLESLMSLVDSTDMMTVLPEMAVRMLPIERGYQVRPLSKGALYRKIVMATRRGYVKQSVISILKDAMVEVGEQICS